MKKLLIGLFLGITLIVSASDIVYITPKGKKYHEIRECRSLKRSKIIKAIKRSQVGKRGACKICS